MLPCCVNKTVLLTSHKLITTVEGLEAQVKRQQSAAVVLGFDGTLLFGEEQLSAEFLGL